VTSFEGGLVHVDTSSSIEYHLLFRGAHEPGIMDLMRELIQPGDVCLDVGANVGAHTLLMAKLTGSQGRLVSLEPHPALCRRLRQNVDLNRYDHVTVLEAALAATDGELDFYGVDPARFDQGRSCLKPAEGATQAMRVSSITGETLVKTCDLTGCDFIKMDVEGAEKTALEELAPLIQKYRPVVLFEYRDQQWSLFGATAEDVLPTFIDRGYLLYTVTKNVARPLEGSTPPRSCEILCIPKRASERT
jgi:FkbM family methyltransferase